MKKKKFHVFFVRYFSISVILFNIILGSIIGLIVRNYQIEKFEHHYENEINTTINQIQNKVTLDYTKVLTLSEIVASQINTPKAFYDFNSLFKVILSTETSINSVFIILTPNIVELDQSLYPLLDSLNRYNIAWRKNANNIVFIDSLEQGVNDFYYNTVKNTGKLSVFNSEFSTTNFGTKFTKTVAFPIFEGNQFIGVVGFSIDLAFINQTMVHNEISEMTFVSDEDGLVLYDRGNTINLSEKFNKITNTDFATQQDEILHNKDFIIRNNKQVLFFKTFKPNPLTVDWKFGVLIPSKNIYAKANRFFLFIFLFFIVFSLLMVFVVRGILVKSTSFLSEFIEDTKNLYEGNISKKIHIIDLFHEIHVITNYIEKFRLRLIKITNIYKKILDENVDEYLEQKNSDDILAISINSTTEKIKKRSIARKEALETKQKTDWINDGLNIIHEAARIEEDSIEILIDKINEKISTYSGAFLSSFFIYYVDNETNEKYLESVSTYGLDKNRAFQRKINVGDGVVGSVALERKKQYFEKIPSDYKIIVSGLSEMKPKSILVQPLEYEGEFYGILEIAFLKKLKDFELSFFDEASKEIALATKNITGNISTNELLEKMKSQTKEINKTKELLENKIKEITKKEQESSKREADLKGMFNAVNNTLMTIEYTTDGILLNANQKFLDTMNYTLTELKGVSVLKLVKSERLELEEVIKKVSTGEYYEKVMKRFTKYGQEKWLHSTYTPYYNSEGKVTKILYFAFDVSLSKVKQEKMEKELRLLKKQIKLLRMKI